MLGQTYQDGPIRYRGIECKLQKWPLVDELCQALRLKLKTINFTRGMRFNSKN